MDRKRTQAGIQDLLHGSDVRRIDRAGRPLLVAIDVVRLLTGSEHAPEQWEQLKAQHPQLSKHVERVELYSADGAPVVVDAVDLTTALHLVQVVSSPRAERIKRWLATSGVERLQEDENPELAFLRTQKLYQRKGRSRRWIDQRLRGMSARHELTREWYKRGARESDEFRGLTNAIMQRGFGLDVEHYRQQKNLQQPRQHLRDHMSDLELSLTALGEMAAVSLHRDRGSTGMPQLLQDARDAGEVVAAARRSLESKLGHALVSPEHEPIGQHV